ncbi:MAG: hypothetical protein ABIO70_26195 [Pseudomonadota bacterium]
MKRLFLVLPVACHLGAPCAVCVDEKCADLVVRCDEDPDCACMVQCLGEDGMPGVEACLGHCGLSERPAAFPPVEECVALACPDAGDECATPADWSPSTPEASDDTSALVEHGGGGERPDCGFDEDLAFDPEGTTLQLQSADGRVCVWLEREDRGAGSLANTEWGLLSLRAGPLGGVAAVERAEDLCWYSSHHNFLDWAHAWTGALRYDLAVELDDHGGERSYALYPYTGGPIDPADCAPTSDGSDPVGGPLRLVPYGS